jgi:hypothetical protein
MDAALLIDESTGDLRPSDIDPDGVHSQQPISRAVANGPG